MHDERPPARWTPRPDEPPSAPSSRTRPSSPPPASTTKPARPRPTLQQTADALRELYPSELAEVQRVIDTMRARRGAATDPGVFSLLLAELLRLLPLYPQSPGVPVARLRVAFREVVTGPELERALLDAEERRLLRLLPVELPAPFVEPGAGIATARGLLYFIAPAR